MKETAPAHLLNIIVSKYGDVYMVRLEHSDPLFNSYFTAANIDQLISVLCTSARDLLR